MTTLEDELDAAIAEEAAAMKEFAQASRKETMASLKVRAARKRLMDARGAKTALYQYVMAQGRK